MVRLAHIGFALTLALAIAASGCGPSVIDDSEVEATDENLEVWDVVQKYRQALEERDVDLLYTLVSREYFENSGTTDTQDDDYGYEVLREKVMPVLRDNVKKVRFEVKLKDIRTTPNRAWADFEYFARFLYTEAGKDGWVTRNDFNRLEFLREDGTWKIASGL
jgi:hypothetical protein